MRTFFHLPHARTLPPDPVWQVKRMRHSHTPGASTRTQACNAVVAVYDPALRLQEVADELKIQKTGLRSLVATLLQLRMSKGEQCADWQAVHLTDECASILPPV